MRLDLFLNLEVFGFGAQSRRSQTINDKYCPFSMFSRTCLSKPTKQRSLLEFVNLHSLTQFPSLLASNKVQHQRCSAIGRLRIRIRVGEPYFHTLTFCSTTHMLTERIRIRIQPRRPGETCSNSSSNFFFSLLSSQ